MNCEPLLEHCAASPRPYTSSNLPVLNVDVLPAIGRGQPVHEHADVTNLRINLA